jgi:hypothetical protein
MGNILLLIFFISTLYYSYSKEQKVIFKEDTYSNLIKPELFKSNGSFYKNKKKKLKKTNFKKNKLKSIKKVIFPNIQVISIFKTNLNSKAVFKYKSKLFFVNENSLFQDFTLTNLTTESFILTKQGVSKKFLLVKGKASSNVKNNKINKNSKSKIINKIVKPKIVNNFNSLLASSNKLSNKIENIPSELISDVIEKSNNKNFKKNGLHLTPEMVSTLNLNKVFIAGDTILSLNGAILNKSFFTNPLNIQDFKNGKNFNVDFIRNGKVKNINLNIFSF